MNVFSKWLAIKSSDAFSTFIFLNFFIMCSKYLCRLAPVLAILISAAALAQTTAKLKYTNSSVFAGIEVGSKGVKMSVVEVGKNAQSSGAFNILKDTSVNTDFISFTQLSSEATLNGLSSLFNQALTEYGIPSKKIFTVISSGVKGQAEKDGKTEMINTLISSFRSKINEPGREVEVVDVLQEARLSHLGIVPDAKRYTTFLVDIGSGNTKGGYFPYGNTKDFKIFQLNWGTKSTANATEKRCDETDKSLTNYQRQMQKVLSVAENSDIVYAVNSSGAYTLSDNIAFSGGIAWSLATLLHPEQIDKSVVTVTFDEVTKFNETLYKDYASLSPEALTKTLKGTAEEKQAAAKEIKRVHSVFDQRSLMAGSGLLWKMMRQFASVYETKAFYFVKSGQVGWISAYVNQHSDDK